MKHLNLMEHLFFSVTISSWALRYKSAGMNMEALLIIHTLIHTIFRCFLTYIPANH